MAHGRMISPPHRGYIGKIGFPVPSDDYDDDGLNAGGIGQISKGHGVCGDPFAQSTPRPHETGGKYGVFPTKGSAVIGKCYTPESPIDITIDLTTNHQGYFRFQVCPLKEKNDRETEECFMLNELKQVDGSTKWMIPSKYKENDHPMLTITYNLPSGLTCDGDSHCVLRWWYTGGNNWGNVEQEQLWNCADISISSNCNGPAPTTKPTPVTPAPTTSSAPVPSTPVVVPSPSPSSKAPVPDDKCACNQGSCPQGRCNNCNYVQGTGGACFDGWTEQICKSQGSNYV